MVGVTGLEPVTPRLSSACSNQLSYTPRLRAVALRRGEPALMHGCAAGLPSRSPEGEGWWS
jgi:hypothetical protein